MITAGIQIIEYRAALDSQPVQSEAFFCEEADRFVLMAGFEPMPKDLDAKRIRFTGDAICYEFEEDIIVGDYYIMEGV